MQYHPSKARAPVTSRKLSTEQELSSGQGSEFRSALAPGSDSRGRTVCAAPRVRGRFAASCPPSEKMVNVVLTMDSCVPLEKKCAKHTRTYPKRKTVRARTGIARGSFGLWGPTSAARSHVRPPDCPRELASLGTKFVPQNHTTP
ncbi:hypothetical protein Pcinc_001006 [Petrolisthes cinctipes]|uniref:Uncharacterized protein n=1 Tax=Petrolisthes cinctipes TaxID=88211 RepID=A0AAE1L675_PETCI|nr:hypothetical protein Pcinc_001006 [Petrolisthes cinctipes]